MRILIVEDEKDLNRIIGKKLQAEGYLTDSCYDGDEAVYYMENVEYDAVILDVMLPEKNGFAALSEVRAQGVETPVLFLSARDQVPDIVKGLDLGADDYMVKPFDFGELLARIRVLTRRQAAQADNIYRCGDLTINTLNKEVERAGKEISLSPKEYLVLECLARHKNIALSRAQIESSIWSWDANYESNVVDVYIRYLRRKIDDDYEEKLIQTVRGVGYMLKCEK